MTAPSSMEHLIPQKVSAVRCCVLSRGIKLCGRVEENGQRSEKHHVLARNPMLLWLRLHFKTSLFCPSLLSVPFEQGGEDFTIGHSATRPREVSVRHDRRPPCSVVVVARIADTKLHRNRMALTRHRQLPECRALWPFIKSKSCPTELVDQEISNIHVVQCILLNYHFSRFCS